MYTTVVDQKVLISMGGGKRGSEGGLFLLPGQIGGGDPSVVRILDKKIFFFTQGDTTVFVAVE